MPSLVAAAVAIAGVGALFLYPVSQAASKNFTIRTLYGHAAPINATESFAHSGTYSFGWSTGHKNDVTFVVWGPGPTKLYQAYNYLAAGSISVTTGNAYNFSVTDTLADNITVDGYLEWAGPAL